MQIKSFRKQNYFLSNFYEAPVTFEGLTYQSNEAAFQAAKLPNNTYKCPKTHKTRVDFTTMTPNVAKSFGRQVVLRPDWEIVKDNIMLIIVRAKFESNMSLKQSLKGTGNATLIEGNTWHDRYWGVDSKTGKGQNKLGKILMQVRQEINGQQVSHDLFISPIK